MRSGNQYEVLGLGGAMMDRLMRVNDAFIEKLEGQKGGAHTVDLATLEALACETGAQEVLVCGGATANTLKGLAGMGHRCALLGKAGKDRLGDHYKERLKELGIISLLTHGAGPSGQVLCLITPDGERTQRPYPGASVDISSVDVRAEHVNPARLVVVEGYALRNSGLLQHTVELAHAANCLVAMGAASFEIVRESRRDFDELFAMRGIDVLFTNEAEAHAFTGKGPEEAVDLMAEWCPTVVVTMGSEGSVARSPTERARVRGQRVTPVDTTGAGDLFAAGFLHGILHGKPLEQCAYLGCLLGGAVIQHVGPEIPDEAWAPLRRQADQNAKVTSRRSL